MGHCWRGSGEHLPGAPFFGPRPGGIVSLYLLAANPVHLPTERDPGRAEAWPTVHAALCLGPDPCLAQEVLGDALLREGKEQREEKKRWQE